MKGHIFLMFVFNSFYLPAQTVADFENYQIPPDTFDNGSDGSGGFSSGQVFLPNDYSSDFDAWTGWALSSKKDSTSAGFQNQYSCIAGSGAAMSNTYAVGYAFDPIVARLSNDSSDLLINHIMINNATYPFLSMRDGDAFSKKFGGPTGSDPDFFLLTIKGFSGGELTSDSINFYLADFRADDPNDDYLVQEWTEVPLSSLGQVDSLSFSLSSSDVGIFGMNTPAYFCIDNISTESTNTTAVKYSLLNADVSIYPNPARNILFINHSNSEPVDIKIVDLSGKIWNAQHLPQQNTSIDISSLTNGIYLLEAMMEKGQISRQLFFKH
jgi:hypothetical protein